MSKIFEEVHIPARTTSTCIKRKCDLCGFEVKGDEWDSGAYEINETEVSITIKAKKGESYPSGGSGIELEVDLCPMCFTKELIPFLNSKGANIVEKEWDW